MNKRGGFVVVAMVFVGLFALLFGGVLGTFFGAHAVQQKVESTQMPIVAQPVPVP